MSSKLEMTIHLLDHAYTTMKDNLRNVTLEEALFVPQSGYRSMLGTLKHAAGWSHVYRSYAFDARPKHWTEIDWPHDLRDTIIKSEKYLRDITEWFDEAHQHWMANLSGLEDDQLDKLRPVHWGQEAPLYEIVFLIA